MTILQQGKKEKRVQVALDDGTQLFATLPIKAKGLAGAKDVIELSDDKEIAEEVAKYKK